MIDLSFLKQLDRFNLIINKKITSNYVGERESSVTGHGLIFKDHTPYAFGDDYRSVDWKVYARTDKYFVKRFEEERNLTVHVVVDFSASMGFGKKRKKSDYASMIGIGFAYMALKNNEKFVLSTFSDKLKVFKPKKGMSQLASMVEYLNQKRPKGTTNLEQALAKYKKMIGSKSYVVIISDFLYDPAQIENTLIRYKHNKIKLVQVLDDTEIRLDLEGDFKLKDSESNILMRTFISPFLRKNYTSMLAAHQAKIKRLADQVGAEFYVVSTASSIFDTFHQILEFKYTS
jgi:uncharacterized protein (DUF58 family)